MSSLGHDRNDAYMFGDSRRAADRLRLLADVFAPSTREFLNTLRHLAPRSIVDVGCGPGYTTRLLAEVFAGAQVLGIDNSASFIELARGISHPCVSYVLADARETPPGTAHDLVYCRYVLTHLADAAAAVEHWSASLRPGGAIAIEENDWIHTDQPAFRRYLEIVEAMLASSGQRLYVGALLDQRGQWPALERRSSELVEISAADRDAAGMFLLNIESWRSQPFIQRNYQPAEIDRLRSDLERLAADNGTASSITFGRRRLVLQRTAV